MFEWARGVPENLSNYVPCQEGGPSAAEALLFNEFARNHLLVGCLLTLMAYCQFRRCASQLIRSGGTQEPESGAFFTPLPAALARRLPWRLSWEAVVKATVGGHFLANNLYEIVMDVRRGVTPVYYYRFQRTFVPNYEVAFGAGTTLLLSAAADLAHRNCRPPLLPARWPPLALGLFFQVLGTLFVSHALWKTSVMVMFLHLTAVPFFLATAASLYLTALWPRSFYLAAGQSLGMACVGLHFVGMSAYFAAWYLLDPAMADRHAKYRPCREWMIVMSAYENLEIVWLGANYIIIINAIGFSLIYVVLSLLHRKECRAKMLLNAESCGVRPDDDNANSCTGYLLLVDDGDDDQATTSS